MKPLLPTIQWCGGGMVNVPINAGNIAPFHSENTSCQHGRGCRHTHDLINETKVW